MNRIRIFLDGDEVEGLRAEADRNLRGMSEQARWWIRQAIAGRLPASLSAGATSPAECQSDTYTRKTSARGLKKDTAAGESGAVT